jgi:hypothetical protein
VKNAHGTDKVDAKLLVTSGMESNLDFRANLKRRDTSISEKQKSESERQPSEADRRLVGGGMPKGKRARIKGYSQRIGTDSECFSFQCLNFWRQT